MDEGIPEIRKKNLERVRKLVRKSLRRGTKLVVVILGDDEFSHDISLALRSPAFSDNLECQNYDFLLLRGGSEAAEDFMMIYQVCTLPAYFILGFQGRPHVAMDASMLREVISSMAIDDILQVLCREMDMADLNDEIYKQDFLEESMINSSRSYARAYLSHRENQSDEEESCGRDRRALNEVEEVFQQSKPERTTAVIKILVPEGEVLIAEFQRDQPLTILIDYIQENLNLSESFVLMHGFPRKPFSDEDFWKTFEELNLCPSSIVYVHPIKKIETNLCMQDRIMNFVWKTFLEPVHTVITSILTYFERMIMPQPELPQVEEVDDEPVPPHNRGRRRSSSSNVHTLFDKSDDESDDNIDNGNSTQQMK